MGYAVLGQLQSLEIRVSVKILVCPSMLVPVGVHQDGAPGAVWDPGHDAGKVCQRFQGQGGEVLAVRIPNGPVSFQCSCANGEAREARPNLNDSILSNGPPSTRPVCPPGTPAGEQPALVLLPRWALSFFAYGGLLLLVRDEQTTLSHWQITREGHHRGIVEIIPELP
jgi:hypothetical protein